MLLFGNISKRFWNATESFGRGSGKSTHNRRKENASLRPKLCKLTTMRHNTCHPRGTREYEQRLLDELAEVDADLDYLTVIRNGPRIARWGWYVRMASRWIKEFMRLNFRKAQRKEDL